ncbi:MAG: histidine kinase [Myxococcota bacterium]
MTGFTLESTAPRSYMHRPSFWGMHVLGWASLVFFYWAPRMPWDEPGLSVLAPVVMMSFGSAAPIGLSLALAWLYTRVRTEWLEGALAAALVVLASIAAASLWTGVMFVFLHQVIMPAFAADAEPWDLGSFFAESLPPLALMMGLWSMMFVLMLNTERLRSAREQATRARSAALQAELKALRSQTHPHFLLNAMNSIATLLHVDLALAERMLHDLSGLFVRSLRAAATDTTSLREELAFVQLYLRCEAVRFEERLEVHMDVPEALAERAIPSLLLQPLVENAIKHGMPTCPKLVLTLSARERGDLLFLEVRNTGRLGDVSRAPAQPGGARESTGLRIVRERLAAMYPRTGRLSIEEEAAAVVVRVQYEPREWRAGAETVASSSLASSSPADRVPVLGGAPVDVA